MIAHFTIWGYAAALADGEASYLLWMIGALNFLAWVISLRPGAQDCGGYRLFRSVALLALPVLLLVGMVVSMLVPA